MSYEFDQLRELLDSLNTSLEEIKTSFVDHYTSMSNANAFMLQGTWRYEAHNALDHLADSYERDCNNYALQCPFCDKPWFELSYFTNPSHLFNSIYNEIAAHICELSIGTWPSQQYNMTYRPLAIVQRSLRTSVQEFLDRILRINKERTNA